MMPSPTEIQQTASSAQTGQKRMRPCLKIGLLLILLSVVLFVLMFVLPAIGFDNDVFFVIALFGSLICFFVGLVMCLGKNPRNWAIFFGILFLSSLRKKHRSKF